MSEAKTEQALEEWDSFEPERSSLHDSLPADHLRELSLLDSFFQSDDLVLLTIRGNRIQAANRGAKTTLGWKAQELRHAPIEKFFHPDDVPPTLQGIVKMGYGRCRIWPARFHHRTGVWLLMIWSVSASKGDPNTIMAAGINLSDDVDLWELIRTRLQLT